MRLAAFGPVRGCPAASAAPSGTAPVPATRGGPAPRPGVNSRTGCGTRAWLAWGPAGRSTNVQPTSSRGPAGGTPAGDILRVRRSMVPPRPSTAVGLEKPDRQAAVGGQRNGVADLQAAAARGESCLRCECPGPRRSRASRRSTCRRVRRPAGRATARRLTPGPRWSRRGCFACAGWARARPRRAARRPPGWWLPRAGAAAGRPERMRRRPPPQRAPRAVRASGPGTCGPFTRRTSSGGPERPDGRPVPRRPPPPGSGRGPRRPRSPSP